ncbi:tyrosinase family protein [Planktotalea sp.]|uniref:tyrosinase family protein n=1 Tax=Planktotalea sp. TaxID=2029877 RepID=UPI003297FEE6
MTGLTRRRLIGTAAAVGLTAALPSVSMAASHQPYVRKNAHDPSAEPDLASYKKAVEVMLQLPPEDPHNWYRYAMIHMSDCPHGNWWFFTWHRPFIGHFEEIIRKYSGDPNFALPYWDWSAQPYLPPQFFVTPSEPGNALDPTSTRYYENHADFTADFETVVKDTYANYTAAQKAQLNTRGFPDADSYWATRDANGELTNGVLGNIATDRSLNRWNTESYKVDYQHPDLVDLTAAQVPWHRPVPARTNVEAAKIRTGLKAPGFAMPTKGSSETVYFNSPISANHHEFTGSAEIEGFPHNTTHNFLGNAMQSLMSPVDPIFFLHHCNVDRLLDVWDQRQINLGLSDQPLPDDQDHFYNEQFLFYVGVDGQPVTDRTSAKDAMEIAPFNYVYTPGTGSELIDQPAANLVAGAFTAAGVAAPIAAGSTSLAKADLSDGLKSSLRALPEEKDHLATVRFILPASPGSLVYELYVAPGDEEAVVGSEHTVLGGTFEFFGMRGHNHNKHEHPVNITYNISDAVDELSKRGLLDSSQSLSFALVTQSNVVGGLDAAAQETQMRDGQLLGVSVATI